jgi:rhodanese-related sulfurtransferase
MAFTTRFSSPSLHRVAIVSAILTLPLLAACGSSTSSDAVSGSAASQDQPAVISSEDLVVIDVRTPSEFAEEHLDGALNINLQADDFVERISELDRNGNYAVYCRSGNRSGEAVAAMKTLGFTNVTDHGSVAEASESLGISVIS